MEDPPVFMGEYQHGLDDKGRLIMPARFRDGLGDRFVVTKGLDSCLFVYPLEEWSRLEEKLRQLSLARSEARAFSRFFFSGASECELDRQGRVTLPPPLREYAKLERDCVVIGVASRVEIWSRSEWERYVQSTDEQVEQIAEKIVDLGL